MSTGLPTTMTPQSISNMGAMFNPMASLSGISPAKDTTTDKVRKFEETISKYEDYTQGREPNLDSVMKIPGLQNIMKGIGIGGAPTNQVPGAFLQGNADYGKIFQDLMKSMNPGHNNYLPDNFKHM